jgi:D-alanyl-D-alanine carboxypeptidase
MKQYGTAETRPRAGEIRPKPAGREYGRRCFRPANARRGIEFHQDPPEDWLAPAPRATRGTMNRLTSAGRSRRRRDKMRDAGSTRPGRGSLANRLHFKHWIHALLAPLFIILTLTQARSEPLQHTLDRIIRDDKVPGAVLLVSGPSGRQIVAAGIANKATGEAMRPDSRFYIASSGKLVTTVTILQMVGEGHIGINDRIFDTVKSIPGITSLANIRRVTLAQLLTHRSGLPDYYTDRFTRQAEQLRNKLFTADESLAFAYDGNAENEPGEAYNYSNTNFVLLGRIAETLGRSSYAELARQRVFIPAGMDSTTVGANKATPHLAHGYVKDDDGNLEDVSFNGWNAITGDGAIVTTATDTESLLFVLFRDGKLLRQNELKLAQTVARGNDDAGYGHGIEISEGHWGTMYGHSGYIPGFTAEVWYIPSLKLAVVFFCNGDRAGGGDVVQQAVNAWLR